MRFPLSFPFAVVAAVCIGGASTPSRAQIPATPENLRFFPKDITRDSLVQVMRGFSFALGVRCEYCHVERSPGNLANMNFAADEKVEKQKARYMLHMVDSINRHLLAGVPARRTPVVEIACVTCHRGLPVPATLASVLTATIERAGIDSAVAQYRRLRATSMTSGRFDFGEWSINEMARHLSLSTRTAEAIAMLKLNQEFYPESTSLDFLIGELHRERGERSEAIARYRAALERDPRNTLAQERLRELGGGR